MNIIEWNNIPYEGDSKSYQVYSKIDGVFYRPRIYSSSTVSWLSINLNDNYTSEGYKLTYTVSKNEGGNSGKTFIELSSTTCSEILEIDVVQKDKKPLPQYTISFVQDGNASQNIRVNGNIVYRSNSSDKECTFVYTGYITSLKNMIMDDNHIYSLDVSGIDASNITDLSYMVGSSSSISAITGMDLWDVSNVTTMFSMFGSYGYGGHSLTELDDIGKWDVSNVTTMACMFQECANLKNLDAISSWNTRSVTSFHSMFWGCISISSFKFLENWNTSSLTDTSAMFRACRYSGITSIDLSKWDASQLVNAQGMFSDINYIPEINLSNWNTNSLTNIGLMFLNTGGTSLINLSGWNTSKVTNMQETFEACYSLTEIKGTLDMSSVTSATQMFYNCPLLKSVNLANINVSLSLSSSPLLTHDCLVSVINALISQSSTGKTLTLGSTNLAKLTADEIKVGTDKNWAISA